MQDHVRLSLLLDCYGELLTERQRALIGQTVEEDLSLSEIAEREGISRQGVLDAVRRGEQQLTHMETLLHLVEKNERMRRCAEALEALAPSMDALEREKLRALAAELRAAEEI